MIARVEKTAQGYVIPISPEMAQQMRLTEGVTVDVTPHTEHESEPHQGVRYASVDEVLSAFEETLPRHEAAYRELAK